MSEQGTTARDSEFGWSGSRGKGYPTVFVLGTLLDLEIGHQVVMIYTDNTVKGHHFKERSPRSHSARQEFFGMRRLGCASDSYGLYLILAITCGCERFLSGQSHNGFVKTAALRAKIYVRARGWSKDNVRRPMGAQKHLLNTAACLFWAGIISHFNCAKSARGVHM